MALTFGGASTDVVVLAGGAAQNTLSAETVLAWVYPTTLANLEMICGKGNALYTCKINDASGNVRVAYVTSGTVMEYITNDSTLPVNTWSCLAYTIDTAASPRVHIYRGSLTSELAECTYGTTTDGTGTRSDDSGVAFSWGNRSTAGVYNTPWKGRIAVAMRFNAVLSLGQLKALQFNPQKLSSCIAYQRLGWNGTGTQPDYSGSGFSGTVTGASVASDVPLPPFVWDQGGNRGSYTVAAATGGPWPWFYNNDLSGWTESLTL